MAQSRQIDDSDVLKSAQKQ